MRTTLAVVCMSLLVGGLSCGVAFAQDVPGIEICTVEKTMERRTSCLQSNIDFLKRTMTQAALDQQQKLDTANRAIIALQSQVRSLQETVARLAKPADQGKPADPAKASTAPGSAPSTDAKPASDAKPATAPATAK